MIKIILVTRYFIRLFIYLYLSNNWIFQLASNFVRPCLNLAPITRKLFYLSVKIKMEEKVGTENDVILHNLQSEWYVSVLYYLDRVLFSYRYYPGEFYTQLSDWRVNLTFFILENYHPRDQWWSIGMEHQKLVRLFDLCTQKMFMDHNRDEFMRWAEQSRRWFKMDRLVDIQGQLNEEIRHLLDEDNLHWDDIGYPTHQRNDLDDLWGAGVAYLKHYFEYCRVKEQESFRLRDRTTNTFLLECVTPEFYNYLGDHVASLLEKFQQDLLFTSEPGFGSLYNQVRQWLRPNVSINTLSTEQQEMVSRVQHAQEVSALVGLLVDIRRILALDLEDEVTNDNQYADLQIRQYRTDMAMLNDPRPRIRRSNLEKIRDRYNAQSL